jgi:MFS family permease
MLRAARADHLMVTSLALALCVSLMWLTAELLIPLRLDTAGFSPADIGLAFSAGSLVFIVSSALAARHADRYATVRLAAIWTVWLAAGLLIPAASTSVAASIAFLLAGGITSGVMIALTYPLGVIGAKQGGFSVAVVGVLLNVMWALAGLFGPTVGGAIAGSSNDRIAFAFLAIVAAATAAWMWARRDRGVGPVARAPGCTVPGPRPQ